MSDDWIYDIPCEIWIHIFQYLIKTYNKNIKKQNSVIRLRGVCKLFREIMLNHDLIETYMIKQKEITNISFIFPRVETCDRSAKTVTIYNNIRTSAEKIPFQYLSNTENLKLTLCGETLSDSMTNILSKLDKLKRLNITVRDAKGLSIILENCAPPLFSVSNIKHLNIYYYPELLSTIDRPTNDNVIKLGNLYGGAPQDALCGCHHPKVKLPYLRSLSLSNISVNNGEWLKSLPSLRKLILRYVEGLTESEVAGLELETLSLLGAEYKGDQIAKIKNLKQFQLIYCENFNLSNLRKMKLKTMSLNHHNDEQIDCSLICHIPIIEINVNNVILQNSKVLERCEALHLDKGNGWYSPNDERFPNLDVPEWKKIPNIYVTGCDENSNIYTIHNFQKISPHHLNDDHIFELFESPFSPECDF